MADEPESGKPGSVAAAMPRCPWRSLILEGVGVTAFYTFLAALLLRPLFDHPMSRVFTSDSVAERADRNLILWILAWDWHALTSGPAALFDANVLHPFGASLAGNEHLLGVLPISGPVQALSGNPLLAYSTALLLSIALCGTAMYCMLRHFGVGRGGALFGGFVYALIPARSHAGHMLQLVSGQYLPFAIVLLDRTLEKARLRTAAGFALLLLWQMLCSVYWAFMSVVALLAFGVARLATGWRSLNIRGVVLALLGAALAGVLVRLIHSPHAALRESGVILDQSASWVTAVSAGGWWKSYLLPPIALREWGQALDSGRSYYLGIVPVLAATSILFLRREERSTRAAPAIAGVLTLTAYVFALGPEREILGRELTLPWSFLGQIVPGFSSMRVPSRFGFLVIAGFAALAGIGMGRIHARVSATRRGPALAATVVALAMLATAAEWGLLRDGPAVEPMPTRSSLPPVYAELSAQPPGALLELPFGGPGPAFLAEKAARSMYLSTFHWRPLLNGYTGHAPLAFPLVAGLAEALPDPRALELLGRATDVRYVIVHFDDLPEPLRGRWDDATPGLRTLHRSASELLLAVESPPPADLQGRLRTYSRSESTTLAGTPLQVLPPKVRSGELEWVVRPAERAPAREFVTLQVEVTNRSSSTWPAVGIDPSSVVGVQHRWQRFATGKRHRIAPGRLPRGRLPLDLEPGQSVRLQFFVKTPRQPGKYELVLGLAQGTGWLEAPPLRHEVVVEPSTRKAPHPTRAW